MLYGACITINTWRGNLWCKTPTRNMNDIREISGPLNGSQERQRCPGDAVLVSSHPNNANVRGRREIFDFKKWPSDQDFAMNWWKRSLSHPSAINQQLPSRYHQSCPAHSASVQTIFSSHRSNLHFQWWIFRVVRWGRTLRESNDSGNFPRSKVE